MDAKDGKRDELGALREAVDAVREAAPTEAQWDRARRNLRARLEAGGKESVAMGPIRNLLAARARWAVAALVVLTVVAYAVISTNPSGHGAAGAYAAAAERLRTARTMTYRIVTTVSSSSFSMPPNTSEVAYKEPGLMRLAMTLGAVTTYTVVDWAQGKLIVVMPDQKQYLEQDLSEAAAAEPQFDAIGALRKLPAKAQQLPDKKAIDGRDALGFLVAESGVKETLWIDAESRDPLRLEMEITNATGVVAMVMTGFRFDMDLDDSLFDVTPPAGYSKLDVGILGGAPSEEQLVAFLRAYAGEREDRVFPAGLTLQEMTAGDANFGGAGKGDQKGLTREQWEGGVRQQRMAELQPMTSALGFVWTMQPENDWHYAGRGVKLGEAEKAIVWYRPTGADNYRVIYGDLSVRETRPDALPAAPPGAAEPPSPLLEIQATMSTFDCRMNLINIDGAKSLWAIANDKKLDGGDVPTWSDLVGPNFYLKAMPKCPGGGTYGLHGLGEKTTCSIAAHNPPVVSADGRPTLAPEPMQPSAVASSATATTAERAAKTREDQKSLQNTIDSFAATATTQCRENLSKIQGAKENWALDNGRAKTDVPTWEDIVGADRYLKAMPHCILGGEYDLRAVGEKATCSIPEHNVP